ncbi:type III pantothenate kinase, partial [bacterium]|nr:type III pantothenate kinase [bacterium]
PILYDNPKEVGADRIVNAVAAFARHKKAMVIVDFGTATTFDVISAKGEYLGGAIAPGVNISLDALFRMTSKLPRIEFVNPGSAIGKTTVHSMQAGVFYGYVGLVDALIERIKNELPTPSTAIATGGLATLITGESKQIDHVEDDLTLEGLRLLYCMNNN